MLLDVSKLKNNPGSTMPFEVSLDLSDLEFGSCRAEAPVVAKGTVRNTAGVYVMNGELSAEMSGVCDRCAKLVTKPVSISLHAVLTDSLEDDREEDPWTFLLENDQADLDDIVTTTFVLNVDSKFLCREDCKGLCPQCGKDLNFGPCSCQPEPDPRLAVLKQLLKEK